MHSFDALEPTAYTRLAFQTRNFPLPFEQFFPTLPLAKGDREMTLGELKAAVLDLRAKGRPPTETGRFMVEYHKKFAIAGACVVFGLLGLGLSLGSKKEARSAAFGLSIAIIFVYYVLIRLGEQAGDTGMLSPFVAMWAANLVLGAAAVGLLRLNHRQAAFDPLDPSHYLALLPRVRRHPRPQAGRKAPLQRRPAPAGR
jgi:lipopolysaccharide export LptBFGC system permease protein LptF